MASTAILDAPLDNPVQEIGLHKIQTDRTQSRASMDEHAVGEYALSMEEGDKFPAAVVYHDGEHYWLADGFHRLAAAKKAGCNYLRCEVRSGTWRDALVYSLQANRTHGVLRTNADRRHSVRLVLADVVWHGLSNRSIADMCGVSDMLVAKVRAEPEGAMTSPSLEAVDSGANGLHLNPSRHIGKDGKEYPATKLRPSPDADDPDVATSEYDGALDQQNCEDDTQEGSLPIDDNEIVIDKFRKELKALALGTYGTLLATFERMLLADDCSDELDVIFDAISKWDGRIAQYCCVVC